MRVIFILAAVAGLAACAQGPSRSFTWFDGNEYRWLNEPSVCAPDGSAVFFQKAKDGAFVTPTANISEENCAVLEPSAG